jgi:predicted secreted Zn-dependent protease
LIFALTLLGCATGQTPEQFRVEQAWAACQQAGRIPWQVKLTRIEPNGRYWISGDAGTYGFQDTQTCMAEKFSLPLLTTPIGDAVVLKVTRSTQYFAVSGDTGDDILASLERNGPKHGKERRAVGLAHESGKLGVECSPYLVTIDFTLDVTLPQHDHVERLSEDLQLRWQRLVASVTAHEQRHVEIFLDGVRTAKRRIETVSLSQPCPDVHQEIQKIWSAQRDVTNTAQDRFDAEDAARVEADRKPLRTQVEGNQARLAAIESEIGSLVAAGEDFKQQRAALKTKIDAVVVRMAAMNAAPAGCPRARPGTALATLCQEHRDLVATANRAVSQYNDMVARQNALVDEHGRLRTATTQLIEAYNWTW